MPAGAADSLRQGRAADLLPVHGQDDVARPEPRALGRRARQDFLYVRRRSAALRGRDLEAEPIEIERVEQGEDQDRHEDVGDGPGSDHDEALPGGLGPVGIGRECVVELFETAPRETSRRRRETRARETLAQRLQVFLRAFEIALLQRVPERVNGFFQALVLLRRGAEERFRIALARSEHARNLHVAAERDCADAVLDSLARRLYQRRREAHVEAPRPHARGERHEEVPGFVRKYEHGEPDDGQGEAHDCEETFPDSSVAISLAARSASTSCSRSCTGEVSARSSVRATTSAIERNGSRPSRKAATAISLAALKTQGAVPPLSPACRASDTNGNVCSSSASNSSVMPAKSSGATVVAERSG